MYKIFFTLTSFVVILFLAACFPQQPRVNSLRVSFHMKPNTLDPSRAGDFISSTLICMIYDGLTRCLPGGSVEPALAEQTALSEDKKIYTFFLRKAFWSDGQPITAYDFERSWKRILDPPSTCAYLCYPIKNGERFCKGECSIEEVGIKALNANTLKVELEQPTPYFYSLTAFPAFLPSRDEKNIYSGPFCIESNRNAKIILAKNKNYWNRQNVFLDQISIHIIPDEMTALQMFERGDLDYIGGTLSPLPPDAYELLQDQVHFIPSAGTTFCTFNTQNFPFNNLHLRKAFAYAIDRNEISSIIGQLPAKSILPPAFSSTSLASFDPALARSHFEKAIQELAIHPDKLESIPLYYKPGLIEKRLALALQNQWKNTLGISLKLEQLEFKTYCQKLQRRNYQVAISSWIAQFDDPISILERFKDADHLKNYPGWENDSYRRLLEEANVSDHREDLFQHAEALLAEHVPFTPIYHWCPPALVSPRVKNTALTPCGGILFERFQTN